MNVGFSNCVFYSVSGNSIDPIGENTEVEPTSEPDINTDIGVGDVSDPVGDDTDIDTDTEVYEEPIEDNEVYDSGNDISNDEESQASVDTEIIVYDYNAKIDTLISVLEKNNEKLESIETGVTCLLLVVVLAYLFASTRRVVKRMFNRKE